MQGPAGFSRQARLLRKRDFDGVFKKPARSSDHFFTILFSQGSTTQPRMGLAIAKKAAKRAVDRNRIKRLCRESFRQQDNLPVVDLVVMTRASAVIFARSWQPALPRVCPFFDRPERMT